MRVVSFFSPIGNKKRSISIILPLVIRRSCGRVTRRSNMNAKIRSGLVVLSLAIGVVQMAGAATYDKPQQSLGSQPS